MSYTLVDVKISKQHTTRPPPIALGINVENPKFPQYAVYSKRLELFELWPDYLPVQKKDMVEACLEFTEPLETLLEENHRLKEKQMGKICLDSRANVIFLSCGHMDSCPQCAPALIKCPVCRQTIKGQLKAFFS